MRKLLAVLALVFFCSCSGAPGGEPPTVTSIKDGNGTEITSSTIEGVYANYFDVLFSVAMKSSSVTQQDAVTFVCEMPVGSSLEQPTITVTAGSAENQFRVTVAEAYKYALLSCILTVTRDVESYDGIAMEEPLARSFVNGCATGDDFNADSRSCWEVFSTTDAMAAVGGTGWSTWDGLLATIGILAFDPAGSMLDYDTSNVPTVKSMGDIYKEVTVDDTDNFQLTLHVLTSVHNNSTLGLYFALTQNLGLWGHDGTGLAISVGKEYESFRDASICVVQYYRDENNIGNAESDCGNGEYYIRFRVVSGALYAEYSTDGTDYTELGVTREFNTGEDLSTLKYLQMEFYAEAKGQTAEIAEVFTTNVTATGQY